MNVERNMTVAGDRVARHLLLVVAVLLLTGGLTYLGVRSAEEVRSSLRAFVLESGAHVPDHIRLRHNNVIKHNLTERPAVEPKLAYFARREGVLGTIEQKHRELILAATCRQNNNIGD